MWRLTFGVACCLLVAVLGVTDVDAQTTAPAAANQTLAKTTNSGNGTANSTANVSANIATNSTINSTANLTVAAPGQDDVICKLCVCDEASKLVNCSDKDLTHHFPDPAQWAAIPFQPKVVLFDRNNLVHVLPFPTLDALETISLSHNHIAKVDNQAFWNLTNVQEIDLSHNHLTTEDMSPHIFQGHYAPENYEPLERVRVLRLGSNALHSLDPDLFMHLPRLEELYLDANPFKVIDLHTHQAVSGLLSLRVLDLSRTGIGALPDHFLHTPNKLERLVLAGNAFTAPPPGLAESHVLQYLDLSENPFTVLNDSMPRMDNLTTLLITYCANLTSIGPAALSTLPSLRELYLHSNARLSLINATALVGPIVPPEETHVYPPLKSLYLQDNALSYLESMLVGRWDHLETLRLDGNPWSCDCENQWMVDDLLPTMERINPKFGAGLTCMEPVEMRGQAMLRLQNVHYHMRCLDRFGNHPERDAPILVGVLVGVLIAAPLTLALVMLWRRCSALPSLPGPIWSGLVRSRKRGGEYSSAFYKPADTEPDFI